MEERRRPRPQKGRRRRRAPSPGAAAVFFCVLGLVTVLAWMLPLRPTMSQEEKRELEKFPEFSVSSVLDGSYFHQIGLWFSDTFPLREVWIRAAQGIGRLHGTSDIVIYGQIGAVDAVPDAIPSPVETAATPAPTAAPTEPETVSETPAPSEAPTEPPAPTEEEPEWGGIQVDEMDDELISIGATIQVGDSVFNFPGFNQYYSEMFAANVTKAADLLSGRARVFNVIVPFGASLLLPRDFRESLGCAIEEDVLPYIASLTGEGVYDVDTMTALQAHNDEYIFFRTDHHWTALGAYYAYEAWAETAGVEPVPLSAFQEDVQEPFQGSLFYKANQSSKLLADQVYTYLPPGDIHLYIEQDNRDSLTYRGFEQDVITKIVKNDKYMCFLAGDHALCTLINNDITDGSACLIIKNSNGNPFAYYFTQHYQYVYVIDYRKYFHRTLSKFVDYYDVDDVIFCLSTGQAESRGGNELLTGLVR